jgi:hypothetical protein
VPEHISSSWQIDTELILERFLEIWTYPEELAGPWNSEFPLLFQTLSTVSFATFGDKNSVA